MFLMSRPYRNAGFLCFLSLLSPSELSMLHVWLAHFLRSSVSKGDLTLLLMCWLTNLGMSSWSTLLFERPVFWFDFMCCES